MLLTIGSSGASANDEIRFWEKEVARLVNVANSSKPILLSGDEAWFGEADGDGYTNLHKVALQLQDALDICIHDNELLLLEHMPSQSKLQQCAEQTVERLRSRNCPRAVPASFAA
jgi:hypothetical protein